MFSRQLSQSSLIELCRGLRHYLAAGLTVRDALKHLSTKGDAPTRAVVMRLFARVEKGDSLESAIAAEKAYFPTLFHSLAGLGEQTGNLPEVFGELEKYFRLQSKLRLYFLAKIAIPMIELLAGIVIVAFIIWFFGQVMPEGMTGFDPLGLGMRGTSGAVFFLAVTLGSLAAILLGISIGRRILRSGMVDALLLGVPVIGPCLRALAMSRYCLAQRLTLETALSMPKAVRLSLRATDNAAFVAGAEKIVPRLRKGETLADSLAPTGLFPTEFLHVITVGEESGKLPEVLEQQATQYEEESNLRMTILSWAVAALVFLFVVLAVGTVVIRFFMWLYGDLPNQIEQQFKF